jgi:hypothetical protein
MRTRKTAHYDGPKAKRPSHGRKPRTSAKASEVRFGLRTPQGDIMGQTEAEMIRDLHFELVDKARFKAELLQRVSKQLANGELPDHW